MTSKTQYYKFKWFVAFGDLSIGFRFVGQFDDPSEAVEWCEQNLDSDTSWWVHHFEDPKEATV